MDLKKLLCALLTSICHTVTAVEGSPPFVGATGPTKKAEAQKGVAQFLDGLVATGESFARDHVEQVASAAIDTVVGIAHDIGAFTHHSPAPDADSGQP